MDTGDDDEKQFEKTLLEAGKPDVGATIEAGVKESPNGSAMAPMVAALRRNPMPKGLVLIQSKRC